MNMAISRPSDRDFYSTMRELKWSSTEKAIARRCFDRALRQELDAAIQSTKETAAKIRQASELWELEHHLTQFRKEIDRKFEYKYSTLVLVFANLVREASSTGKTCAVSQKKSSATFASTRGNPQL
jgi:Photoprotection regulator fluorescence recovery protein